MFQRYEYEGYVLVAGGWDGHHNLISSEVLGLNGHGRWRTVGDLSQRRRGLQLAVIEGGKVVATGGRAGSWTDTVDVFDIELETWKQGPPLSHRRAYHAVTPVPLSMFNCDSPFH